VKTTDLTVVMATHSPNHAFYFEGCDTNSMVALMNHKQIAIRGTPSAVLTEENMFSTFNLQSKVVPYTWEDREMRQIVPLKLF